MVLKKIAEGLKKTRASLSHSFKSIFSSTSAISDSLYEDIEEILIQADVGMESVTELMQSSEQRLSRKEKKDAASVYETLRTELHTELSKLNHSLHTSNASLPTVILVVGVNGTGKTTSVAKLVNILRANRKSVILAACDTFRGAAIDQLEIWAQRTDTPLIKHLHGSDAAAVAYDAAQAAVARKIDYLIIDTAGRLHTNKNLMAELQKVIRVIRTVIPEAPHEILMTIDAITGQNALPQIKTFNDALHLSGIILTKLDGTAKGGIVIRIQKEFHIPVKFVGVGEKMDDLLPFNPKEFVNALFFLFFNSSLLLAHHE
ncbi:signal recognition particle-docking protein FtsY [bacterium]|nr:signal recognition particle-docking protein FtsY [bacterium]